MNDPVLKPYRDRLDRLDDEIVDRFVERMRIVREIGRRKRERALPVLQNDREEEILHRTKTDPHSLGRWRVNGTLPHITPFVEAFNLKPGDPMYLEPEKRAHIW